MTDPAASPPTPSRRGVLLLAATFVAVAGWIMFRSYTSAEARECQALYRAAHTSADTARVDRTLPAARQGLRPAESCRAMRGPTPARP